ncbi:MAG: glycerol-3-phosphate 1-O-acyltransferase PlsY [Alphaproteobacteria bacterium]|jgi:acyl phosphate:glycerol-3-phosphate acyltransferase|nr:glycerol-3-phosphate 1-O-acyltransferase PlsY [Alphaproteobacteria bacterium]MBT4965571.1 glycerol-3-phosphate 1-O-acyltransferase PlsY [Alphaproteobacteria bacterium]MBT5159857.1 glycerol-3-phosphate 1-O-acyltransferase PlsY [Alphaproteobacteria bacterium]MBT5917667.1 glycerol-3-phosphate 1-O-acyltransferase PlsY [Alphaproteobacteria bacterium]MBT6387961.1 glycerol-3-phosphate 1-O-acyltransferase PlsY [Alphaproteobacteria bacterium]
MPQPMGDITLWWPLLVGAFLGYLLGSIPFGLVLTRLGGYGDLRKIGSGNIGATNVLRTGNKPLALTTLILDSGKGAAAVLIGGAMYGPDMAVMAGGGAFLGHLFPIYLKFRGGKGVATTLGILIAISWPVGLSVCLTWAVTALIFRISSLSGLMALAASPVVAWYLSTDQVMEFSIFLAVLVWVRHHENIRRILKGEEPGIGKKKDT